MNAGILACFSFSRGTENFQIEVSLDLSNWTTIVDNSLQNIIGISGCTRVPLETFIATQEAYRRYIRFTIKTYYGNGGGLQFINWEGYPHPTKAQCPSTHPYPNENGQKCQISHCNVTETVACPSSKCLPNFECMEKHCWFHLKT